MGFWRELRRRHIFRIAAVYAATGWLVLQLGAIVFPALHAPSWALPVLIGFVALGFPVALVLAWAFEVTPEGMHRTAQAGSEAARPALAGRRVGRALDFAVIAILAVAVGVLAWRQFGAGTKPHNARVAATAAPAATHTSPAPATAIPANSIAVLPFLDLSPKHDQEYFAEGIAEQLLDILAQATDLKVAARTSAFQFKGKPEDVTTIGQVLRVRHVLEGSVRRDGDLVRITVQLIDARTDYHEWSQTYQRKMTDIFKVQDEISKAIADHLEAQLGPAGGTSAVAKADPSTTPDAYDEYLLGRHLINQRTGESLRAALVHLKKAVALDADYAPAYAQIAIVYSLLIKGGTTYGDYTFSEANALAEPYLERAVTLAPDAPETQAARGRHEELAGHMKLALAHYSKAVAANPSYMDAVTWKAMALGALGRFREQLATYRAGARRDPLNWLVNYDYMVTLLSYDRVAEARPVAERFLAIDPAQGHQMLAAVDDAAGNYAGETRQYLMALKLRPGWRVVTNSFVQLLEEAGLYEDAYRMIGWNDGGVQASLAGHRDEALAQARRYLDDHPQDVHGHIGAMFVNLTFGLRAEAKHQADTAWHLLSLQNADPNMAGPLWLLTYAALLRQAGETAKATEVIAVVRPWIERQHARAVAADLPPIGFDTLDRAMLEFLAGQKGRGLAALETALRQSQRQHNMLLPSLGYGALPQFDAVRHDPRFQAIVRQAHEQQADIRAEVLPVLCNWDYPADGWHPLPATCARTSTPQVATGS